MMMMMIIIIIICSYRGFLFKFIFLIDLCLLVYVAQWAGVDGLWLAVVAGVFLDHIVGWMDRLIYELLRALTFAKIQEKRQAFGPVCL